MVKKKNEPKSRTITAEDMRASIGFRYLGVILLVLGALAIYYVNPWMVNDGRCSEQSGVMCPIGAGVSAFVAVALFLCGLFLLMYSYFVILHDTDEYKRYYGNY